MQEQWFLLHFNANCRIWIYNLKIRPINECQMPRVAFFSYRCLGFYCFSLSPPIWHLLCSSILLENTKVNMVKHEIDSMIIMIYQETYKMNFLLDIFLGGRPPEVGNLKNNVWHVSPIFTEISCRVSSLQLRFGQNWF